MSEKNDIGAMLPVSEWCRNTGTSYSRAIRLRKEQGVGHQVPPHTWMMTKEEFLDMMEKGGEA